MSFPNAEIGANSDTDVIGAAESSGVAAAVFCDTTTVPRFVFWGVAAAVNVAISG